LYRDPRRLLLRLRARGHRRLRGSVQRCEPARRARGAGCRVTAPVHELEEALVARLLRHPEELDEAWSECPPESLQDLRMRTIMTEIAALVDGERLVRTGDGAVDVAVLAKELERDGELDLAGGAVLLGELLDAGEVSSAIGYAKQIRRGHLERRERELHDHIARGDDGARGELAQVEHELEAGREWPAVQPLEGVEEPPPFP